MSETDLSAEVVNELAIWHSKGNSLLRLASFEGHAGKLSLLIPKYNNTGIFSISGFSNYSGALSFFGTLVDRAISM